MIEKAFKCLLKDRLKIKLSKCSFFKEQICYLGHIVSRISILPFADKIEALMKLRPPNNIKEVRHFLGLTGYYQKLTCNYADITHPLNCLMSESQPFVWTPECPYSFDMLHSNLANTPIVELPDPNKLHSLFTDVNKFHYSDVHTQASTRESNEALIKILTSKDPLDSVASQTQDLRPDSNIVHPVVYISGSVNQSQCRRSAISKKVSVPLCPSKCVPFIYKMLTYYCI